MTETCADDSPRAAPAAVQVVDGFFVPKAVVEDDATTPLPLFKRFEMVPASWSEFQRKLAQLEKERRPDGACRQIKVVYFLRHAQGTHNEAHDKYGSPRWEDEFARTEAFLDAPLTPFGVQDAQDKGRPSVQAELEKGMSPIERVVVSPISRAIQTAQNFFTKEQVPGQPFTCIESCRETFDCHTCNKRRPLSELKRRFPDVDFSRLTDEEDQLWSTTHRETTAEIQKRAREFLLEFFREVPERYVVVAAHLSIIEAICAVTLGSQVRPSNCEVVPIVLEAV
ncbi:phosphoglycerate mutase family [Phytophthora cinnamomi]|uniref:phosphoglycerate mutase family n=1 Tax=Phytophthora cinnamomi TaxID=4785 RepID=UPI003559B5EC|nr:phosphoglycerate mutase family [Phytophthora cinnamomi]